MFKKPTSFDIAQMAGVSQPTVSRALRGSRSVNQQTRMRIEAIAQQLNYRVDKNASNLRSQHSDTLALLLFEDATTDDSHINPFFLPILGSITRAAARQNYDLLVSFQQLSSDWHVDFEDSRKADGLILLGYGDYVDYAPTLQKMVEHGTHFVRWGLPDAGQIGTMVGSDNVQGGRDATSHLIQNGRRHIAFIGTADEHYPEFMSRYNGYTQALAAIGIQHCPECQVDAISSQESGYIAMTTLLGRHGDIDGVFAASDMIAIGAMRAAFDLGKHVPEDIAIVGFDDIPAADFCNPSLTTVVQDVLLAGEALVETLLKLIRGEDAPNMILPTRLVVRKSCGNAL